MTCRATGTRPDPSGVECRECRAGSGSAGSPVGSRTGMLARMPPDAFGLTDDPLWYKDAIIYELHVRTFYDSDGDGVGDFLGLTQRLDYLQDLGVTALWLDRKSTRLN